jgi:hypothetical protein
MNALYSLTIKPFNDNKGSSIGFNITAPGKSLQQFWVNNPLRKRLFTQNCCEWGLKGQSKGDKFS